MKRDLVACAYPGCVHRWIATHAATRAFSVSIFTHLPETMQFAWLDELNRVTRPGGILLLTIRGARFFSGRSRRARRSLEKHGFYYFKRRGTHGLPGFYQQGYHSEGYVRREWNRYLDILEFRDKGIAGNQDLVICRKRQESM